MFALPLFLQGVIGYTAFETGLVFLALAMGAFVAAPTAARAAHAWGPRRAVTLGMGLEAIGIVATSLLITVDVSGFVLAVPLFVYGIGVGFATAQLTSIVLSDIPPERSGLASGANSTMRQVGSALGIAILGTVLFTSLGSGVRDNLASVPGLPAPAIDGIANAMEASAGQALIGFRADPQYAPLIVPVEQAFVDATRLSGIVATGFVLVGVLFSLLLPHIPGSSGVARTAVARDTGGLTRARPERLRGSCRGRRAPLDRAPANERRVRALGRAPVAGPDVSRRPVRAPVRAPVSRRPNGRGSVRIGRGEPRLARGVTCQATDSAPGARSGAARARWGAGRPSGGGVPAAAARSDDWTARPRTADLALARPSTPGAVRCAPCVAASASSAGPRMPARPPPGRPGPPPSSMSAR